MIMTVTIPQLCGRFCFFFLSCVIILFLPFLSLCLACEVSCHRNDKEKVKLIETEHRTVVARVWEKERERRKQGEANTRYTLSVRKRIRSDDLMWNMMSVVANTVLYN